MATGTVCNNCVAPGGKFLLKPVKTWEITQKEELVGYGPITLFEHYLQKYKVYDLAQRQPRATEYLRQRTLALKYMYEMN